MTTRIYTVTAPDGSFRLVSANSQQAARNHVAKDTLKVAVADSRTTYDAAKRGFEVEVAGEVQP